MKEFIQKYQKAIVGTGAVAVLVVCYFQQKELSKLRAEQKIEVVVGGDIQKANTIDSLEVLTTDSNFTGSSLEPTITLLSFADMLNVAHEKSIVDKHIKQNNLASPRMTKKVQLCLYITFKFHMSVEVIFVQICNN